MKNFFRKAITLTIVSAMAVLFTGCPPSKDPIILSPTIGSVTATDVTPSTATLTISVSNNGGAEIKSGNVVVTGPSIATITIGSITAGGFTATLSNLLPNSNYSFVASATNSVGLTGTKSDSFTSIDLPTVKDFDGNPYHIIMVAGKRRIKEPFRGTHFLNGDPIKNETDAAKWPNSTVPVYCWYNNDPELGKVYGGLYNFKTVTDPRGLLPGFHSTTGKEWVDLENSLGDYSTAGPALMEAGNAHWKNPWRPGTNTTGWGLLPNGAFAPDATGNYVFMNLGESFTAWNEAYGNSQADIVEISITNSFLSIGYVYSQKLGIGISFTEN
jgi:uncharacterized protein (TIGR02145 family)